VLQDKMLRLKFNSVLRQFGRADIAVLTERICVGVEVLVALL
jgi:hypothetical protein